MDEYIGVVAICGEEGTGKTTMALTFPKPLVHFDIDVGGYRRAAWRLSTDGITSKSYPKPIDMSKMVGVQSSASSRAIVPKRVTGLREIWTKIYQDYAEACMSKEVKTIVMDSATLLWVICHQGYLQELQEKQVALHKGNIPFNEDDYRERLQPVEYTTANERMRTLLYAARSYQKNLILIHYPTDEYGPSMDEKGRAVEVRTGRKVIDGFKETVKLADLVLWLRIENIPVLDITGANHSKQEATKTPVGKITKCGLQGLGLAAVGQDIVPATFDGLVGLMQARRVDAHNTL